MVYLTESLNFFQQFIYNSYAGESASPLGEVVETMKITSYDTRIIQVFYDFFMPAAYALVAIYFLIEFIEKVTSSNGFKDFDEKFYIIAAIKLLVADIALHYGSELISAFLNLNNYLLDAIFNLKVANAWNITAEDEQNRQYTLNALYEVCSKLTILNAAPHLMTALVNNIINAVVEGVLFLHAIQKRLEVILMSIFSGIALSLFFSESGRNGAIKYFKKFAACIVHAAAIIMIMKIITSLNAGNTLDEIFSLAKANIAAAEQGVFTKDFSTALGEVIGGQFKVVIHMGLYGFASIGLISVAKSIINDAFGT